MRCLVPRESKLLNSGLPRGDWPCTCTGIAVPVLCRPGTVPLFGGAQKRRQKTTLTASRQARVASGAGHEVKQRGDVLMPEFFSKDGAFPGGVYNFYTLRKRVEGGTQASSAASSLQVGSKHVASAKRKGGGGA